MRSLFPIFLLSFVVGAPAVAAPRYLVKPQANETQIVGWDAGVQYTDDVHQASVVRIVSISDELPSKPSTFRVILLNQSDKTIVFGPNDVRIELPDGKSLAMIAPDEIDAKLRRDIKRRQALANLGNAFSAQSANGEASGSFSYSGWTSNGTLSSGMGSFSYYDPLLAQQQQQAAEVQSARTDALIQERKISGQQMLSRLVRQTSVAPGGITGGIVAFDAPKSIKNSASKGLVKVVVRAGEVLHRFDVKLSKVP